MGLINLGIYPNDMNQGTHYQFFCTAEPKGLNQTRIGDRMLLLLLALCHSFAFHDQLCC
jgi:hypothetical protein